MTTSARSASKGLALAALALGVLVALGPADAAREGVRADAARAGVRAAAAALYMSADGSDSGQCTAAAPCRTFSRAYAVGQPGQTVYLRSGDYGDQTIVGTRATPPAGVPKLVFAPDRGASVSVGYLQIHADNFELRGLKLAGFDTRADSDGFTARGVDMNVFGVFGSSNTKIIGGDVGPSYNPGGSSIPVYITYGNDGTVAPTNLLIDGVLFHDFKRGTPDDHMECMMVIGGSGITIRNSRFLRCDIFDIYFTQWAGPDPPRNILLENNWFDETTTDGQYGNTTYAVRFGDYMREFTNILVRYNSAKQDISMGDNPKQNVSFIANVAPNYGCTDGIFYAYNVWNGRRCGPTDRRGSTDFVDASRLDLRLPANAPAVDHGDKKNYPRRDIFGHKRPRGKAPDAGAVEVR